MYNCTCTCSFSIPEFQKTFLTLLEALQKAKVDELTVLLHMADKAQSLVAEGCHCPEDNGYLKAKSGCQDK